MNVMGHYALTVIMGSIYLQIQPNVYFVLVIVAHA